MKPLLSILIPTLPERAALFQSLRSELERQRNYSGEPGSVEIITDNSPIGISVGSKRNGLLSQANGLYIKSIDDDDEVSRNLIRLELDAIKKGFELYPGVGVDCLSLRGVITWDGKDPELFEHSIRYPHYKTNNVSPLDWFQYVSDSSNPVKYERFPLHLNTIRADIAKQFKFPDINHGEDRSWAEQIFNSGLIKTEYYIDAVTYHYKYISKK